MMPRREHFIFCIFYLIYLIVCYVYVFTTPPVSCINYLAPLKESQTNAIKSILGAEPEIKPALCKSDVVRLINEGKPIESCQAIKRFNLDAFEGAEYLRQYQYDICIRDL